MQYSLVISSFALMFPTILNWIPFVVLLSVFLFVVYVYESTRFSAIQAKRFFRLAICGVIGFRVSFAGLQTGLQYYAWASNPMGKLLLPPTQSIAVFLRYVWTHFWLNAVLSLCVGLLLFVVLKLIRDRNDRFLEESELEMGTLLALVVGWPHFVLFFPLIFALTLLLSGLRMALFKQELTPLGMPLIVAAGIAIVFAIDVLSALHLTKLFI